MQNLSFKFHNFLFQSYKFEFCHFNSLNLIYSQLSPPLRIRLLLLLSIAKLRPFCHLFNNFKKMLIKKNHKLD